MRLKYSLGIFFACLAFFAWSMWSMSQRGPVPSLIAGVDSEPSNPLNVVHIDPLRFSSVVTDIQWIESENEYLFSTKEGTVSWVNRDLNRVRAFFNVPHVADGKREDPGRELGFLSTALAPDWRETNVVYFSYTFKEAGNILLRLSRAKIIGGALGREQVLINEPMPNLFHFGGNIRFGPDGMLYFSIGDNSRLHNGPETSEGELHRRHGLLGSILRLKVNSTDGWSGVGYDIPTDNPFVETDGARPEVWAWGFRNPWKFTFDSTGRLFATDVGENFTEELNLVSRGGFYGWPFLEGVDCSHAEGCASIQHYQPQLPVARYGREAGIAIVGVVEHTRASPSSLAGKIIFADHVPGRLWALNTKSRNWRIDYLGRIPGVVTAIAEAADGGILASGFDGGIYLASERGPTLQKFEKKVRE